MCYEPDEARIEEVKETPRSPKCRIPQRCPPLRSRTQSSKMTRNVEDHLHSPKPNNNDVRFTSPTPRMVTKCTVSRPRSTENRARSAQNHEEKTKNMAPHRCSVSDRVRRQSPAANKKVLSKRPEVSSLISKNQATNLQQKMHVMHSKQQLQDVPKEYDESELDHDFNEMVLNATEEDEHTQDMPSVTEVMLDWQEKKMIFDKMKSELESRQNEIMDLYAVLKKDKRAMSAHGHQLPSTEELKIMNVARMSSCQLFQLYTGSKKIEDPRQGKGNLNIDVNKFYNMPNNIIGVCDQTLTKRKEIIDWFETLIKEEKGISTYKLTKKINQFNAENEVLKNSLQTVKAALFLELDEIVGYLKKSVNETIAFQLRTEDLTYELSELNSLNADLRKQLHTADNMKSPTIKYKIQELEKELKEEKCNKKMIRDRLTRAEGQLKIGNDRVTHLEAALEQARQQNWTLERTVQQLNDQNQKLQSEFDKELNKFTESIRVNTVHLEEIAMAREKLQIEKEDLEKRLEKLSDTYNKSLEKMQREADLNSEKLAEAEKKFDDEKEDRQNLDTKLNNICAQLFELELRYKDTLNQLQEKDIQYNEAINSKNQLEAAAQKEVLTVTQELEAARQDLELANIELDDYRKRLMNQGDTIREIEHNLKETISLEKNLTNELKRKEEYIEELVKKQTILEQQLQEGESKMESYEKQMTCLKENISKLRKDFGEFENLTQLHDMMNQQRTKLLEATLQCSKLANALEMKDLELEGHLQHITEQEAILDRRDGLVKLLKDKEVDQNNMIKLLKDNLEMRAQADTDLSQQIVHKNREIETHIANLETSKQQILQLEKIILGLEDQLRKINSLRRKDQERINLLDKTLNELEASHTESNRYMDTPVDNLDDLIKILEDELGTSCQREFEDRQVKILKKQYFEDRNKEKLDKYEHQDGDNSLYQAEHDKMPTKIVMGNFVKKTYLTSSDEKYKGELDHKKAITNIDAQNWVPLHAETEYAITSGSNVDMLLPHRRTIPTAQIKDQCLSRKFQLLTSNQRDEKKCKMFKLAGHRL